MPVAPRRLNRVAAYVGNPKQLKCLRSQGLLRPLVERSHDVHLALAHRAGTAPAQRFQGQETLPPIGPFYGQFFANPLNIQRSHRLTLPRLPAPAKKKH